MNTLTARLLNVCLAASLLAGSLALGLAPAPVQAEPETPTATITVREGNDFATQVLGDAWDMSQTSDVLRGMNYEGRYDFIRDYTVSNGVFSGLWVGQTQGTQGDQYLLWPGYSYEMLLGQVGGVHPIQTSKYRCLYLRMDVDRPLGYNGDFVIAGWQGVNNTAQKGNAELLIKESEPLFTSWRLDKIDLTSNYKSGPTWTSANWAGLSFKPTIRNNVRFALDWARLTDCVAVNVDLSWKAVSGQARLWAGTGGRAAKDILIDASLGSDTSVTWDVQGIQPGEYGIAVETSGGSLVSLDTVVRIEAAPVVRFSKPSATSGPDYASMAGNAWDMDGTDIRDLRCIGPAYNGGILEFDTAYPAALPGNCKGGIGEADPQFWLKLHGGPIQANLYRYFSFSMYINGTVPLVPDGMIGRLIWTAEKDGNKCIQVSDGIPYETGWNTYTIDLWNPALGRAEQVFPLAGSCSPDLFTNAGNITDVRFDPNENYTGVLGLPTVPPMVFHHAFDWFKLTREDQVKAGSPFPIDYSASKALAGITFYYTTDRANPTQRAVKLVGAQSVPPAGNHRLYLPLASKSPNQPTVGAIAAWDTAGVTPGKYFICAAANDGYNSSTWCSDAPVNVLP